MCSGSCDRGCTKTSFATCREPVQKRWLGTHSSHQSIMRSLHLPAENDLRWRSVVVLGDRSEERFLQNMGRADSVREGVQVWHAEG